MIATAIFVFLGLVAIFVLGWIVEGHKAQPSSNNPTILADFTAKKKAEDAHIDKEVPSEVADDFNRPPG